MIEKLLKNPEFAHMLTDHCADVVAYLLDEGNTFGVVCNLADVTFDPELPDHLRKNLKPLTLFLLAGYSFESARLDEDEDILIFEAGFGEENFGSVVSVPLESIIQVTVGETVVFVNLTAGVQRRNGRASGQDKGSVERSFESFLSNPENQKFLKKK